MELPHLLAAMTTVVQGLGGVSRDWRFDRMTTVVKAGSHDLTAMFAAFGKHYGVRVIDCRPRSGNRKGVVEKNNHTIAQRWWRTVPDEVTLEQAQTSIDLFAAQQDNRRRNTPPEHPPLRPCGSPSGYARCHLSRSRWS